jgi:prolyl-tRNA editing enzyme YbaK/EbsC (Cys-tRNA(Pro) deacylase)
LVARVSHVARSLPGTALPSSGLGADSRTGGFPLYPPEQVALTIALRDRDRDRVVLAVVPADAALSLAKARRALHVERLCRATIGQTRRALPGTDPVAIPPFGALLGVPAVVDRRLLTYNRIVCNDGTPGGRRLVDAGDLLHLGHARVADLCE